MLKKLIITPTFILSVTMSQVVMALDDVKIDYKALTITQLEAVDLEILTTKDKKRLLKN